MNKEEMQKGIMMADKRREKKKLRRMISYMIFFTIGTFIFIRKYFPKELWEDALISLILGVILGFVVPLAITTYCGFAKIQISYPEDRDLAEWLRVYKEKFGEDFYGPWSH